MPKFSIKIFLPAAGLGERLRPITYHIPKPLLPVLGKPLLEIILDKLEISSGRIGINLHYKPELMRQWIKQSAFANRMELFPEDSILGTGGALKNAEAFLSDNHFLVHNADILSDIDFTFLIETHLSSGNIATLATHNYPKYNNVVVDENGYVIDVENPGTSIPNPDTIAKKIAYTGIAVYSPEILKFLPSGVSHTTIAWIAAAKAGHKIRALDFTGCYWSDIGTPATYASAIIDALRKDGETVYIHPSVKDCNDIDVDGYIAIEREAILTEGSSLRNCIMLPGSKTESRKHYENCILGAAFRIDLKESEVISASTDESKILISTGGSDRKYYRIEKDGKTAVLMECRKNDPDFERHIEYTKFLSRYSIPVPDLLEAKTEKMQAVFEDLGDISLYSRLKCRREPEQLEAMYRKVLDIAVSIHTKATANVSECPMLQSRVFDYEHFRLETSYFMERFVEGIRGIKIKNIAALDDEFHGLAQKADSFPKTIIHRDFQSQNIMIHKGIPRLIDYQGARMGPSAYDVASILWDPYYRLEDNMRERLLEYYFDKMKAADLLSSASRLWQPIHPETLIICRLQRHMQALGAYGFLSAVKGKRYFLKHIHEGLRLLKEDVALVKNDYPVLYGLVMEL
ncbi:MAG: phosphotransferase [Nitrospirae bacterium]|nr:phosphotransferase [Nitrospirota bacterium]MBI3377236.1 phosphotransferase [Nitrospirota bacterium]